MFVLALSWARRPDAAPTLPSAGRPSGGPALGGVREHALATGNAGPQARTFPSGIWGGAGGQQHPCRSPQRQLTRDLATGAVSGRQSLNVPINRDTSDAVQAFLDGVSSTGAGGAVPDEFPATREKGVRRTEEEPAGTPRIGTAPSGVARPEEDAESFAFRDPARLSFADSLAAERVKGRAGQSESSVVEGQAALESFTPRMQARIRDQYQLTAPASGGEARVDGSAFRATMAASALSEEISERQAGALGVLAGLGDDRLSTLFAEPRGVVFAGGGPSALGGPQPEPGRRDDDRHCEGRQAASLGHLSRFEDELSQARPAPLIVEQPAPPAGRE